MLQLQSIRKTYQTGDFTQTALNGVSLNFRENEFVAVLGVSGSGKTTMLNIIGGLDSWDEGDLVINGVSTKRYRDRDWDTYRNHSIGFVFQNYNLITHQSVLSNVELALTLSGVSRADRRRRATEALERVGLKDHIKKRPSQLSGGQMQRVAIARALINDPDILLADEPTGALDSETSLQVMDLLKEIANDRLVIMVTHNPELAEKYATRIVRLRDGNVISDSNPYEPTEVDLTRSGNSATSASKTSMSFFTSIALSMNNLLTKKGRTFLVALAGSIGIIGIALILSLSNGVNRYISRVEEDTLSTYPIMIESQTIDITSMMSAMTGTSSDGEAHDLDKIYSNNIVSQILTTTTAQIENNDLRTFMEYLKSGQSDILTYANAIQYGYNVDLNIYSSDTSDGIVKLNPSDLGSASSSLSSSMFTTGMNVWQEMLGNEALLDSQYDVVAGHWPEAYNEVVLIVDENNEISDYMLYSLDLMDYNKLQEMMIAAMTGKTVEFEEETVSFTFNELLSTTFKLVLSSEYYEEQSNGIWLDRRDDEAYMTSLLENAVDLEIVGIIRPSEEAVAASISGAIGYTSALTEYLIEATNNSKIVTQQLADPDTDVFTGLPFEEVESSDEPPAAEFDMTQLTDEQREALANMTQDEIAALMEQYSAQLPTSSDSTYDSNIQLLGVTDLDNPSSISIYPIDFDSKEAICEIIDSYNKTKTDAGQEEYTISYTDIVGLLMSSITTILNVISYVLIAFVSISLIVSSIMIGIITYISVLERTKEIGILRSVGASKRDISRVFNAETLIIGFVSGSLGILVTLLLLIPINLIIQHFTFISGLAALPLEGGVALIIISVILTLIAGLIPSKMAARKDPVEALRME